MVPVAGEDPVVDRALVQGKAHMGAPVVHGPGGPVVVPDDDGHRSGGDDTVLRPKLFQGADVDAVRGACHANLLRRAERDVSG